MGLKSFIFKKKEKQEQSRRPTLPELLQLAAYCGQQDIFEGTLIECPDFPFDAKYEGDTLLIIAVQANQPHIVKFLLESCKVDGDLPSDDGYTPLVLAIKHGVELVSTMLATGKVDVNKPEASGITPFANACRRGDLALVDMLMANPTVKIDEGSSFNGRTPLMAAADAGEIDVVRRLLASGRVDIERADIFGTRAVQAAAAKGHDRCLAYLLQEGGAKITNKEVDELEGSIKQAVERERMLQYHASGQQPSKKQMKQDEAEDAVEASGRFTVMKCLIQLCGSPQRDDLLQIGEQLRSVAPEGTDFDVLTRLGREAFRGT